MTVLFAYSSWDKKFRLRQRVVYGGVQGVTRFTREYGGILVNYYTLGQTLQNHGVPFLNGIAQWSHLFYLSSYSC